MMIRTQRMLMLKMPSICVSRSSEMPSTPIRPYMVQLRGAGSGVPVLRGRIRLSGGMELPESVRGGKSWAGDSGVFF